MNLLFLTIAYSSGSNIYSDLMQQFKAEGHNVWVVCQSERRNGKTTEMCAENGINVLRVKTGNLTGRVSLIEKGLTTISLEALFKRAIKKYLDGVKFDIILYSTPPITFCNVVDYIKKRYNAKSYLLLKDIFPQNAVDLGMMSESGIKRILYRYFSRKEKQLYAISDFIGCMSQANADYVLNHNPEIYKNKVEVCPNSIKITDKSISNETRNAIREKYNIPLDRKVFVYGGNLGKPQGIDFLINCLKSEKENAEVYFLIVGDGTEFSCLKSYLDKSGQQNAKLLKKLPKDDYDALVAACDIGMIFLDHRFTIPNFPSRLLAYMQAKIPVFAVTDANTDIGRVITDGKFGWWCESNSTEKFSAKVAEILQSDLTAKGVCSWIYLNNHYSVEESYRIIMKHFQEQVI